MKKIFPILLTLFFVLIFQEPSISSEISKKALFIGINKYKNLPFYSKERGMWITNLEGSVNDVQIMREALTSFYGFRPKDIKILIDREATRENILKSFEEWLIKGTKEGDLALFYFSGHGSQVPDQNGDEEDGLDEVLCPYDVVPQGGDNIILDDELGVMLRRLPLREVVVIVDSCHSGTMTRSIRGTPVSVLEETPATRAKFIPLTVKESFLTRSANLPCQKDHPDDQIFISSSKEDQLSLEIFLPGGYYGGLTCSLVEGMRKRRDTNYLGLFTYARDVMKSRHRLEQDPQIEPIGSTRLANLLFSSSPTKPAAPGESSVAQTPVRPGSGTKPQEPPLQAAKPEPSQPISRPSLPSAHQEKPSPSPGAGLKPPQEIKGTKVLVKIDLIQGGSHLAMDSLRNRIGALPYVELVKERGYFDCLIRGEMKENIYLLRVLNRVGDVVRIPPSGNVRELTTAIAPHLEYAYIVKQLAHISNPDPSFRVSLSLADERRDFRVGEKVVYDIFCEEDCYLLLLNLDSTGSFHVIFPNQYHADNFVKAGRILIPDEKMRTKEFEFRFSLPAGEETVKLIATSQKLDLRTLHLTEFDERFQTVRGSSMKNSSPSRELVKDILTHLKEKDGKGGFRWSEHTLVVRSHE
jgi:hypothetical protein